MHISKLPYFLSQQRLIFFIVLLEHPVWPQSQKESRKCDAGRRSFDESTSNISRINCLWSLMLEVRGKFAHQTEVSSRSDGLEWQSRMREQLQIVGRNIFLVKNPCNFCKIFQVHCSRVKKKLDIPVRSSGQKCLDSNKYNSRIDRI